MTRIDLGNVKGKDGVGISSIVKIEEGDINTQTDKYRITFTNGGTFDYTIANNEYVKIIDEIINSDDYVPTSKAVLEKVNTIVSDIYTKAEADDTFSPISHAHDWSSITSKPSTFTPSSHTHGNLQDDGKIKVNGTVQASRNVITDSSGNITTETKATIDSSMSSSSTKAVQNKVIKAYVDSKFNDINTTIESQGGIVVDSSLDESSANPVQNQAIYSALDDKVDKVDGKGLSTNDYTTTEKNKLEGLNNYTHPSYTARTGKPTGNQTPSFGGTATVSQVTSDATGHVTGMTDRTIKIPSTIASLSVNGLMSSTDKAKLDGLSNYTHPSYTARTGVPTANATPSFGGTFTVSQPVSDGTGHVTAVNSRTITIPSTSASSSTKGLVQIETTPTNNSTKAITSGGVYTAIHNHTHTLSNINDYCIYEITPSTYNPKIGSTITITLTAKNGNGDGIVSSDILTVNNDKYDSTTYPIYNSQVETNNNGTATVTGFPILSWGIIDLEWNGVHCQLFSDGWLPRGNDSATASFYLMRNRTTARLMLHNWESTSSSTATDSGWIPFGGETEAYKYAKKMRPYSHVMGIDSYAYAYFRIHDTGLIKLRSVSGTMEVNKHHNGCIEWSIRDEDLDNYKVIIPANGEPFLEL